MTSESEIVVADEQKRRWLLSRRWTQPMTEEDGGETWQFPFELRKSTWGEDTMYRHGNRYWWDLDEAFEFQKRLELEARTFAEKAQAAEQATAPPNKEKYADDLSFLIRDTAANCLAEPSDPLAKEIFKGTPEQAADKLIAGWEALAERAESAEQQVTKLREAIERHDQRCKAGEPFDDSCVQCINAIRAALAAQEPAK